MQKQAKTAHARVHKSVFDAEVTLRILCGHLHPKISVPRFLLRAGFPQVMAVWGASPMENHEGSGVNQKERPCCEHSSVHNKASL